MERLLTLFRVLVHSSTGNKRPVPSESCLFFYLWFLALVLLLNEVVMSTGSDREPVVDCYIVEELHPRTPVGCSIIRDYGLDRKYNSSVLSQLRFSFLVQPGADKQYFSIEEEGGIIRTTRKIDREELCPRQKECVVKFDVAVRPINYLMIIKVRVEILDINDNSPTFDQSGVSFEISESTDIGTSFPLPVADDLDSVQNGINQYEIVPPLDAFELSERLRPDGSRQVRLVLKQRLDRELKDFYQFSIVALDRGDPVLTAILPVNVTVLDANDNAPLFDNTTYEVRLREDVAPGTAVLRVRATDADLGLNGAITYNFTAETQRAYGRMFEIREDRGVLFTKDALDFETQPVYLLYVTAFDRGEGAVMSSQASIVVRVEDINDNAPSIRVNAIAQNALHPEVMEGSEVGSFVAHVTVEDRDSGTNGRFHCRVLDSNLFDLRQMYPTEFKVVTLARFDREVRDEYVFSISCRDNGTPSLTSSLAINVKVADRNDHSPAFLQESYLAYVDENNEVGSTLTRVTATDRDSGLNGRVTYSVDRDAESIVTVDERTGLVTSRVSFDYENTTSFEVKVIASDSGSPPRTASAIVYVTVRDVDDEVLIFTLPQYTFIVEENQPSGTEVGIVTALDRDSHPSNKVFYFLDHVDTTSIRFRVNSTSGLITAVDVLDREEQATYDLLVGATPLGAEVRDAVTSNVIVYVGDVNDNRPAIEFPTPGDSLVFASAHYPIGHVITKVKASDRDSGFNAKLHFKITDGNTDDLFRIDPETGDLSVNRDLGSVEVNEFMLEVTVTDSGDQPLSERANLAIRVRQELSFPRSDQMYALLASEDLAVVLVIALATILVAIVIIVAIICIARKGNHRKKGCGVGGVGGEVEAGKFSDAKAEEEAFAKKKFFLRATSVDLEKSVSAIVTTLADELHVKCSDFETAKPETKPVIVFIKDPMIKKISPNSDSSNSDSGRGHSSEEGGDTLRRTQSLNRDNDAAAPPPPPPTSRRQSSLAPTMTSAVVANDSVSLSNDVDGCRSQTSGLPHNGYAGRHHHPVSGTEALFQSPLPRLVVLQRSSEGRLAVEPALHCSHLSLFEPETTNEIGLTGSSTLRARYAGVRSTRPGEGWQRAATTRERSLSFHGEEARGRTLEAIDVTPLRRIPRDGKEGVTIADKQNELPAAILVVTDRGRRMDNSGSPSKTLQRRCHQMQEAQLLLRHRRSSLSPGAGQSSPDRQRTSDALTTARHLANASSTISSLLDSKNGNHLSTTTTPPRCYGDDDVRYGDVCYGDDDVRYRHSLTSSATSNRNDRENETIAKDLVCDLGSRQN